MRVVCLLADDERTVARRHLVDESGHQVAAAVGEREVGEQVGLGVGQQVGDRREMRSETAVKRVKKEKGYIVAFSFGKGAYEEVARVKTADGLDIRLVTVADLLADTVDLVTPDAGLFGGETPVPAPRDADSRPTVEELVASDHEGKSDSN